MKEPSEKTLLRIFTSESAKIDHKPAFQHLVSLAKEMNIGGVTVIKGVMGYGSHRTIHTSKLLDLSSDLPIIVEAVDDEDKIIGFIEALHQVMPSGTATLEKVRAISFH
jgi:hypothetical protein